jgi:hypothetical protein
MRDSITDVLSSELLACLAQGGYSGPPPHVARLGAGAPALALLWWPMYQPNDGLVDACLALERAGYHGCMDSFCVVAVYRRKGDCLACKHMAQRKVG